MSIGDIEGYTSYELALRATSILVQSFQAQTGPEMV